MTSPTRSQNAFTIAELLVSIAVLALLLGLILQLFNSTAAVSNAGNRHMDSDAQARALLDRMLVDIGSMVKRSDVDYYLKGRPAANNQVGDDQIAFYSQVAGYYPASGSQSPVSLVAYRLNATTHKIERLGKGLVWNAVSTTNTPVVFLPIPLASPLPSPLPSPMPSPVPTPAWPQAANQSADPDGQYETTGPQVFRFEYYYVLKGQSAGNPSILSDTPWDSRSPLSHNSVEGLRDVAAIGVTVAVIDAKSRVLVTDAQLTTLAGQMNDFSNTLTPKPGDLEAQWLAAVNASALPLSVRQAIRVYGRTFSLNTATQ